MLKAIILLVGAFYVLFRLLKYLISILFWFANRKMQNQKQKAQKKWRIGNLEITKAQKTANHQKTDHSEYTDFEEI